MNPRLSSPVPVWWCLGAGILAAVVGLLPWLITGARLPIQNLWVVEQPAETMPRALLPFSQYYLTFMAALLVVGGAVAGLVARATSARLPRAGLLVVILGVVIVHVAAIVQTALTVDNGLQDSGAATLYLAVVIAAAVLSSVFAVLVAVLVGAPARPANVIGLAAAAVLAGSWVSGLVFPPGSLPRPTDEFWLVVLPFVAPVLVGVAIAWGGLNTVGRVLAAAVALVGLWIGPAMITAISSAAGSRVLASRPNEMIEYATEVFRAALTTPSFVLRPLVVAVVVAALGLVISRLARGRVRADQPEFADPG